MRFASAVEMQIEKNINFMCERGYTDGAKQVNNRTTGEDGCKVCVFIFDKNACSCFAYFAAICPVRKTCLAAGQCVFCAQLRLRIFYFQEPACTIRHCFTGYTGRCKNCIISL